MNAKHRLRITTERETAALPRVAIRTRPLHRSTKHIIRFAIDYSLRNMTPRSIGAADYTICGPRQGRASYLLHEVEEIEVLCLHHRTAKKAPKKESHYHAGSHGRLPCKLLPCTPSNTCSAHCKPKSSCTNLNFKPLQKHNQIYHSTSFPSVRSTPSKVKLISQYLEVIADRSSNTETFQNQNKAT